MAERKMPVLCTRPRGPDSMGSANNGGRWSILYFGDRWDDFWRRRQQLAYRLSQYNVVKRVLYVEDYLTLTSLLKYLLRSGRHCAIERWKRVRADKSLLHVVSGKLSVISPVALLPANNSTWLTALDQFGRHRALSFFLERLMAQAREENWILWVSIPWIPMPLVRRFRGMPVWYDCTEDFSADDVDFPPLMKEMCQRNDATLTKEADIVTVSARSLYEEKKNQNQNVYWLPNAVDVEMFAKCKGCEAPSDIANLQSPRIAFVGAVNHQRDWGMIEHIASVRPDWSFVVIGPIKDRDIVARFDNIPHVHFIGPRPYQELPAYLQHCDACIEFYKAGRLSQSGQSLKLSLYLAAGKPIVATPSDGAECFRDALTIANTREEYLQGLENVLANDNRTLRQKRKRSAAENSWDRRAQEILAILRNHLSPCGLGKMAGSIQRPGMEGLP